MTSQSGGGGGIKGVTSDGLTPGGEIIAGALTAGDPNAASVPSFINFYGAVAVYDVPGSNPDDDITFSVEQLQPLMDNFSQAAVLINRQGALNGFNYSRATLQVSDSTDTTAPIAQFNKQGITQFQVDGDGVQVHGKFKTGAAVAHVLGAFSGNAVPIYNEAGTLLGYMPLYA